MAQNRHMDNSACDSICTGPVDELLVQMAFDSF